EQRAVALDATAAFGSTTPALGSSGAPVAVTAQNPGSPAASTAQTWTHTGPTPGLSRRSPLLLAGGAVAIILITLGAVWLVGKDSAPPVDDLSADAPAASELEQAAAAAAPEPPTPAPVETPPPAPPVLEKPEVKPEPATAEKPAAAPLPRPQPRPQAA